jgi:hypothetical protein
MSCSAEICFIVLLVALSLFVACYIAILILPAISLVGTTEASSSQQNISNATTASPSSSSSGNESFPDNSGSAGKLQTRYTGIIRSDISAEVARALGLNETYPGIMVTEVIPNSPAETAGLRGANQVRTIEGDTVRFGGDIIIAIDGNRSAAADRDAFLNYLRNEKTFGENITLTILRNGQVGQANLTITPLPEYFWYIDQDEGIRIQYPSDWEASHADLGRGAIIRFLSPEVDPDTGEATVRVVLSALPSAGVSLEEQALREREGSPTTRNVDVRARELSGEQAYESIFYDYGGNATQKVKSVFSIRDGQIYTINYISDPSRYDDYLPMFEEMVKSFRFDRDVE